MDVFLYYFFQIGGKLKVLVDAELSGSDTVGVEAQFGQVNKVEADIPILMDEMAKRYSRIYLISSYSDRGINFFPGQGGG